MSPTGKAINIISRFPSFYAPEDPSSPFHQFIDVFGTLLDQVEADLVRVLRSHYVNTAENIDSQGFAAAQKGDLDRIFTLYLEQLGGTSQLMQVNQAFQAADLQQVAAFIRELPQISEPLSHYIWSRFSTRTQALLRRYDVLNCRFPLNFNTDTARNERRLVSLVIKLIACGDALTLYLRRQFSPETRELLEAYDGSNPVPIALKQALAIEFNRLLRDPFLLKKVQERTIQVKLAIALRQLQQNLELEPRKVALGQAIERRLSLVAQRQLADEQTNPAVLQVTLTSELRLLLPNITLCQQWLELAAIGLEVQPAAFSGLSVLLQSAEKTLVSLLFGTVLGNRPVNLTEPLLSAEAQRLSAQKPTGDDLERLNRMLLETVFPDEILVSKTPSIAQVQTELAKALNERILSDRHFYWHNRASFAQVLLTPEAQRLIAELSPEANLAPQQAKALQRLNRLLLEAAYPNQIQKSYIPYRERLLRLIEVLKTGASTKEGIVDIVAANLGISTDPSQAVKPWEQFLFNLPLSAEESLGNLTASPTLRQAFADREVSLSYSSTVVMEEVQQRWVITDVNSAQIYTVRKQADRLTVHRQLIRVIEYLPESLTHRYEIHPQPDTPPTETLPLPVEFVVHNPNLVPTAPEIQIRLRDRRPEAERLVDTPFTIPATLQADLDRLSVSAALQAAFRAAGVLLSAQATVEAVQSHRWHIRDLSNRQTYTVTKTTAAATLLNVYRQEVLPPLTNLRLVNQTTGQSVQYLGMVNCDDVLLFLPDGTVLINGVVAPSETIAEKLPPLPLDNSRWHLEASIGYAEAVLDQTLFDFSLFEQARLDPIRPNQVASYALDVKVTLYKLTPGSFMVKIPWDIEGYTDQFNETSDHPRHQIQALIHKVRAAGVRSVIAYEKQLTETQELIDRLTLKRSPFTEIHELEEYDFDLRSQQKAYNKGVEHEMSDTLVTAAMFDYTSFDTLNTFA